METILAIFQIIALAALAALCIALIRGVKRALALFDKTSHSLDEMTTLMRSIEGNLTPVVRTLDATLKQTGETVGRIDRELENASAIVQHFRAIAGRVDDLERRLQQKIEGPLMQAASLVSGLSKAVIAFSETFGRKR